MDILADRASVSAIKLTMVFIAGCVGLTMALGMFYAVVMTFRIKGISIVKAIILMPWIIPESVTAYVWKWLFSADSGLIYYILLKTGLITSETSFFFDGKLAMAMIILANVWRTAPFVAIMTYAKLSAVPDGHVEAARIDGANALQVFRYIKIPWMMPIIKRCALLLFVWSFNSFSIIYILTNGGPAGATTTLPYLIRQAGFQNFNFSRAAAQYAALSVSVLIIIFPIYWIMISSFKTKDEIISYPPKLFPGRLTLDNYVTAFREYDVLMYLKNSLVVTVVTVILTVIIAALAAYAMCFFKFAPAKILNNLLYLMQILPTITMLVPLMTIYRLAGIQNTYASLILTYTASITGVPIALILISGYFKGVPVELFESASIDGAGSFQAFCKILLPLGAPGLVCTAIYVFVQAWQEFMFAVNLVTVPEMYTLPVGLQSFVGMRSTDWGGMMATCTMIAIPAVVLFTAVQNYFVDNLAGSVKE